MAAKKEISLYQQCEEYIFNLFRTSLPTEMCYHNFRHAKETADACQDMIEYYKLEGKDADRLLLAAWFHDTGFTQVYDGHEAVSQEITEFFLRENGYDGEDIQYIKALIASTEWGVEPQNLHEEILHDADIINVGKKRFFRRAELLRLEWEHFRDLKFEEADWQQKQFEFLESIPFYTKYAQENFSTRKSKNLLRQAQETTKAKRKEKKLGRGIETMYRAVYRNHINLSSIADSKANMMISVNTIIISVVIAGVGSGFTFSEKDFIEHVRFTIPVGILVLGAAISALYAILSALPKVTNKKVNLKKIEKRKSSVLFFGNFVDMELDKFINSLKVLREDQNIVYDNMSVDIYHLGGVLKRKYQLLNISYMCFLVALMLCVVSFLGILVFTTAM